MKAKRPFWVRVKALVRPDPMKAFRADTGQRYEYGGGWRNRIEWFGEYKNQRVCGWKSRIPQEGDWLLCPMQSGQTGVFRFSKVEHCSDPSDMFFADMEAVGYDESNKSITCKNKR